MTLVSPVNPRPQEPNEPAGQARHKSDRAHVVGIKLAGSPLRIPALSPMADWISAENSKENLDEDLVHIGSGSQEGSIDLGAHFRGHQQLDSHTPAFGVLVWQILLLLTS